MRITADYADDADALTCERHCPPTPLTRWVSATAAESASLSASIREIRGSISVFRISDIGGWRRSARHANTPRASATLKDGPSARADAWRAERRHPPAAGLASQSPRVRAFTLVELLVSVSVLVFLVLLLSSVFTLVNSAWTNGEGNSERRRSVRALADFIGTELQGALLPVEGIVTNGKGNLQFIVNPPSTQVPADYRCADALFWQAPLATETSQGEIAEIGYFVKWVASPPQGERPVLCRFFVNPSIASGSTTTVNPDFLIYDTNPKAWLSQTLLDKVAPATKASGYVGMFAENVVGLWVRCYGLDGTESPVAKNGAKFDSREGYDLNKGVTPADPRYLPASVRISLAQVDSRSAARLGATAASLKTLTKSARDASDFLDQLNVQAKSSPALAALLPGVRIYTTEIQLLNAR